MTSEEFRNDSLFLRDQFPHDGVFEMPIIKKTDIPLDDLALIGYDKHEEYDVKEIEDEEAGYLIQLINVL